MPTLYANPDCTYQVISPTVSYALLPLDLRLIVTVHENVSFIFNAQHDCEEGKCSYTIHDTDRPTGKSATKVRRNFQHSNHNKFFVNLHALHNAWRLREVLPRNLTDPVPYVADREEFHHEMARKLQKANPKKRARAKEKAKETRERKKRAIEQAEGSEGEADPES